MMFMLQICDAINIQSKLYPNLIHLFKHFFLHFSIFMVIYVLFLTIFYKEFCFYYFEYHLS